MEKKRLASEDVIINAPMSFVGSAQRAFRLKRVRFGPPWLSIPIMVTLAIVLLTVWWFVIACWYVAFGLLLLPYRVLRRGARKRKKEALRHREVMAEIARKT